MLVVSRKVGQRILIGEKIAVTVLKISGGGVRIGIDAPAEMPVMREELAAEVAREALEAQRGAHRSEMRGQRSEVGDERSEVGSQGKE